MSSHSIQQEVDERSNLTSSNKFEMLLFRLGSAKVDGQSELFGINVFKIREIVAMPEITEMAGASKHMLGMVNLRGQIIPVIDLPAVVGVKPLTGLNIMLGPSLRAPPRRLPWKAWKTSFAWTGARCCPPSAAAGAAADGPGPGHHLRPDGA